jgi:hypothetical protein
MGKPPGGIDALQLVSHVISQLPGHEKIREYTKEGLVPQGTPMDTIREELEYDGLVRITDLGWLKRHHDTEREPRKDAKIFEKIYNLFFLPYWSRLCVSKSSSWLGTWL